MHMADALISPAVGGTLWLASAGTIAYCSRRLSTEKDDRKVALMGILGAFIFAAQMINFTIPGTGSSGHLGGGLLLAILLGPHAAFLVMASVLTVQALFFADGGLLALGCNTSNLAFFPCFIAYPYIYRKVAGRNRGQKRIFAAAILSAVVGLQLGALAVIAETVISGITELPFLTFAYLMQPLHLVIGIVEGCVTAGIVMFLRKARPETLLHEKIERSGNTMTFTRLLAVIAFVTIMTGGVLSWFASEHPDGLEWSLSLITGNEELQEQTTVLHRGLAAVQHTYALFPGYGFRRSQGTEERPGRWPAAKAEASLAGLTGGVLTLLIAGCLGLVLKRRKQNV